MSIKCRQRHTHCKHFNGVINDKCLAGMEYPNGKQLDQCWNYQGKPDPEKPCPHAEYPTAEDIEAEERRGKTMWKNIANAREAIVSVTKGHPSVGCVICPVCGKTLFFRQSENGHIHAKCSSENCVAWME